MEDIHQRYMKMAILEARKALDNDEVPVGAVVVFKGKVVGRGYNQVETLHDATAHAEMLAITSASETLASKYLDECYLYVTLEPCLMCAGAIENAHLPGLVYGASDPKNGFTEVAGSFLKKGTEIISGVMSLECGQLLTSFFKEKRLGL